MIHSLLAFIKRRISAAWGGVVHIGGIDVVNYIDQGSDPPSFHAKINLLVIRLEQETQLQQAERFSYQDDEGRSFKSQPPLYLNAYVLVAAKPNPGDSNNYYNYEGALQNLSKVLALFQANPVFKAETDPDFPSELEQIIVELAPLTLTQQNEIWSSLKTAFLPSVCYKMKMLVFREQPVVGEGEIESLVLNPQSS
ncbi:MAG: DUF4255 domain-containing protein [Saprospiraceae bacterium]|nr:DUF4255 domain-containing protein [Saprospiraceae bacterium]